MCIRDRSYRRIYSHIDCLNSELFLLELAYNLSVVLFTKELLLILVPTFPISRMKKHRAMGGNLMTSMHVTN